MLRNRCLLFIFIIAASLPVFSQRTLTIRSTDTRVQVEKVADSSFVFLYPELMDAVIVTKDGRTSQAKLNYSMLLDEMHMQTRRGIQAVETNNLKNLEIGSATFIHRGEEGYFEVLSEGRFPLLMKRQIRVSAMPVRRGAYGGTDYTSAIDLAASIATNSGGDFNREIFLDNPSGQEMDITLRYSDYFVIEKSGQLIRLNNQRQLLRDFPEYRNELRDFIRSENINFSNQQDLVKLVNFMEEMK
ncbi:MAG: hypothetical protein K0B09_03450 [Bacteroidales bacterium]|nr:hypothetical protein [Bacteroidales bacterium]